MYSTMKDKSISLQNDTAFFQSMLSPPPPHIQSFFTSHQLKNQEIKPIPFVKFQPDWLLGVLLFCFIILAWVQVFYSRRLRQIMLAPFSKRFLNQLIRDGNLFSEQISFAMSIIYLITLSIFLYEINEFFLVKNATSPIQGLPLFGLILILMLGFWILKVGVIRFLSLIFRTRQTSRDYLLNILIFNIMTGFFFLPILVMAIYLKYVIFLWICLVIFGLFLLFRLIRGFLIGISITKFSYLFLFVYLCSLEMLPLIVLLKVILNYYL